MHRETDGQEPEQLFSELRQASIAELKERWRACYGNEPHRRMSRELLTRAVAYALQEQMFGGLKPETRQLLERTAAEVSTKRTPSTQSCGHASPGSVLIREWHGSSHQVMVHADGVTYRKQRYRSLSEVARLITGTRWSGPLFFGLKAGKAQRHAS
jgi:hypothetical protein